MVKMFLLIGCVFKVIGSSSLHEIVSLEGLKSFDVERGVYVESVDVKEVVSAQESPAYSGLTESRFENVFPEIFLPKPGKLIRAYSDSQVFKVHPIIAQPYKYRETAHSEPVLTRLYSGYDSSSDEPEGLPLFPENVLTLTELESCSYMAPARQSFLVPDTNDVVSTVAEEVSDADFFDPIAPETSTAIFPATEEVLIRELNVSMGLASSASDIDSVICHLKTALKTAETLKRLQCGSYSPTGITGSGAITDSPQLLDMYEESQYGVSAGTAESGNHSFYSDSSHIHSSMSAPSLHTASFSHTVIRKTQSFEYSSEPCQPSNDGLGAVTIEEGTERGGGGQYDSRSGSQMGSYLRSLFRIGKSSSRSRRGCYGDDDGVDMYMASEGSFPRRSQSLTASGASAAASSISDSVYESGAASEPCSPASVLTDEDQTPRESPVQSFARVTYEPLKRFFGRRSYKSLSAGSVLISGRSSPKSLTDNGITRDEDLDVSSIRSTDAAVDLVDTASAEHTTELPSGKQKLAPFFQNLRVEHLWLNGLTLSWNVSSVSQTVYMWVIDSDSKRPICSRTFTPGDVSEVHPSSSSPEPAAGAAAESGSESASSTPSPIEASVAERGAVAFCDIVGLVSGSDVQFTVIASLSDDLDMVKSELDTGRADVGTDVALDMTRYQQVEHVSVKVPTLESGFEGKCANIEEGRWFVPSPNYDPQRFSQSLASIAKKLLGDGKKTADRLSQWSNDVSNSPPLYRLDQPTAGAATQETTEVQEFTVLSGLSEGCVGCFGDMTRCSKERCMIDCMPGIDKPKCLKCTQDKCSPSFFACAGYSAESSIKQMPPALKKKKNS